MADKDHLRWVLERQLHWISAADAKLAILVPLPLAMTTFTLIEEGTSLRAISVADFPTVAAIVLLLLSLLFAISSLVPRVKGPPASNVFFGLISARSAQAFEKELMKADDNEVKFDLAQQIHINATIASIKHKNVTRAIYCLAISMPLWIISVAKVGIDGVS